METTDTMPTSDANTKKHNTLLPNGVLTQQNDTREVLRPYNKQRLGFEGVLIHILPPNRKNGFMCGLVFASVCAPEKDIELDHVVITVPKREVNQYDIKEGIRYYFTADVAPYFKTTYIMGMSAKQEHFMLCNINPRKMRKKIKSNLAQPTSYVQTRICNILKSKAIPPRHTREELIHMVTTIPNDGSVECFIDRYTETYQHTHVNKADVIEALYAPK